VYCGLWRAMALPFKHLQSTYYSTESVEEALFFFF